MTFTAQSALSLRLPQQNSYGFRVSHAEAFSGTIETIGLTSSKNKAFVEGLDCYDTVLTYDEVPLIPVGADTLIFDVAGNADVVAALHTRLGNTIPYSGAVENTLERRCLRSEPRSTRRKTRILVSTRSNCRIA